MGHNFHRRHLAPAYIPTQRVSLVIKLDYITPHLPGTYGPFSFISSICHFLSQPVTPPPCRERTTSPQLNIWNKCNPPSPANHLKAVSTISIRYNPLVFSIWSKPHWLTSPSSASARGGWSQKPVCDLGTRSALVRATSNSVYLHTVHMLEVVRGHYHNSTW